MSHPDDIRPYRCYRHKITGQTAGNRGAHPSTGTPGNTHDDWEIITKGWTICFSDGTSGLGRLPFTSLEEAETWLLAHAPYGWIIANYNRKSGRSLAHPTAAEWDRLNGLRVATHNARLDLDRKWRGVRRMSKIAIAERMALVQEECRLESLLKELADRDDARRATAPVG